MSCKKELEGLCDGLTDGGGPYKVKHRGACLYLLLYILERGMLFSMERMKLTARLSLFIPIVDITAEQAYSTPSSSQGRFFWFAQYGQN